MFDIQALIRFLLAAHMLVVGPTGVGKNNFISQVALEFRRRRISQTWILPHENGWKQILGEIIAREIPTTSEDRVPKRLIIEDVGRTETVIMRPYIMYSTAGNFLDQMMEDRLFEERALDPCVARLAAGTKLSDTPAKEENARLAIRLFQEACRNGATIPDYEVGNLLDRDHPIQDYALSFCKNPDIRRGIASIKSMGNDQYAKEVKSAIRFLNVVYQTASVIAHSCLPSEFDRIQFFREGGLRLVIKGKASDEEFQNYVQSDFLLMYRLAKEGLLPLHFYGVDEVNNYGLMNDFWARALSTTRAYKLFLILAVQLLDFPTPEITKNVLSNCSNRAIFRQEDPDMQEFFARDLRGQMDEYKVHHTDEDIQQLHDGFTEIERITKGKSGNNDTESVTTQLVPRYKQLIREKKAYQSGAEQTFWDAQRLGQIPVGSMYFKTRGAKPELVHVPLLRDSFVFEGKANREIERCLTQLYQRPPYQTPVIPPSAGTTSSSPANETGNGTNFSTFIPLPQNNSSKPGSTRQPRRRGKGSGGTNQNT